MQPLRGMPLARNPTAGDLFSAARTHILAQHEDLRRRLLSAFAAVDAASSEDPEAVDELRLVGVMVLSQLKSHMAFEESVLLPLFAASAPPGPSAASALVDEHRRQRAELTRLIDLCADGERSALCEDMRALIADVLADMAVEERTMLALVIEARIPA